MPNWCYNVVTITGDNINVIREAAEKSVKNDDFFNTLVPRPTEKNEDWYNWNCSNWGTKWDISPDISECTDNSISLSFDTAWSPPIEFYRAMEEKGYTVEAYYYEPGMAFAGMYIEGFDDSYQLDNMSADEIKDTLPIELDEAFGISQERAEYDDGYDEEYNEQNIKLD